MKRVLNGEPRRPRNAIGWRDLLDRARGSNVRLALAAFDAALDAVAAHEPALRGLSDAALTDLAHVRREPPRRPDVRVAGDVIVPAGRWRRHRRR